MAQYGRPISDISTGGWTTTPLWSDLDDNSDADFISSSKNPVTDTFENALTSTLSDPTSSAGHIIRARMLSDKANNGTGNIYLYQGTTLIASYAIPGNIATAWTTYSYTLTGTEADSITDYTALRIRVDASGTANNYVHCAWTELEIPDAVTATEESVTLAAYKGVTDANYASVPGASSLAKFVGESATTLANVQESVLQAKQIFTTSASITSEFESVSLAKSAFLTVLEVIWVAPVEESISLAKALGLSSSLVLDTFQSVNLARFAGVTQISQVNVNDSTSLNRINTIPSASLGTLYDLLNLNRTDGLTALETVQGQTNESVVLAIFKGIAQNSQVNVNDSTSLNRINTIPTGDLGTIFDLVNLSLIDTLSVLEEAQGTTEEAVILNRFGGLTTLEEVQGAIYETVILNKLLGISQISQGLVNNTVNVNVIFGVNSVQDAIIDHTVSMASSYGLSSTELLSGAESVALAKTNGIALLDNVVLFDDITLLTALFMLAAPTSNFEIEKVGDANVYAVRFRDKRFGVIFRDKRAKGGS
jgi:hypothetical protein